MLHHRRLGCLLDSLPVAYFDFLRDVMILPFEIIYAGNL